MGLTDFLNKCRVAETQGDPPSHAATVTVGDRCNMEQVLYLLLMGRFQQNCVHVFIRPDTHRKSEITSACIKRRAEDITVLLSCKMHGSTSVESRVSTGMLPDISADRGGDKNMNVIRAAIPHRDVII